MVGGPAWLNVGIWGLSTSPAPNDHHVEFSLNGSLVADEVFDGVADHPISAPITVLKEGGNTLEVKLPLDTGESMDIVVMDNWGATYAREFAAVDGALTFNGAGELFEVQNLPTDQVVVYRASADGDLHRLTAVAVALGDSGYTASFAGTVEISRYYVAAQNAPKTPALATPPVFEDITSGAAEYLVITHPDFLLNPGLSELVAKRSTDYSVKVVSTDQTQAQFGFGVFGAESIAAYIKYAVENLGTKMVHLVGGDTFDYQDYLNLDAVSFVPSLYVATGPLVNVVPSDPKYADVDGDDVPDVAIGRTPASTDDELQALVDKILDFEMVAASRRTSVFAADLFDGSAFYSFSSDADAMIDSLPEAWREQDEVGNYLDLATVYLDDYVDPLTGLLAKEDRDDARATLIAAINDGPALTALIGHSSLTNFTFSGLLDSQAFEELTNVGSPTVLTQWGCWNTYYVQPREITMAHKALLSGQQGAVAVLGASTLSQASHERALGLELYPRMLTPGVAIGEALLEAKQALARKSLGYLDVLLGLQYLGDPALTMGVME